MEKIEKSPCLSVYFWKQIDKSSIQDKETDVVSYESLKRDLKEVLSGVRRY